MRLLVHPRELGYVMWGMMWPEDCLDYMPSMGDLGRLWDLATSVVVRIFALLRGAKDSAWNVLGVVIICTKGIVA